MNNSDFNNGFKIKLWKKAVCTFLSVIIAFGTFVTMTFGNILLSDWIDVKEAFAATSLSPVPVFYRHGELVGIYRVNYTDTTNLQYKIGDNGEWTDYSVPFAIPAHQTTKVYARIGTSGQATYMNLSNTNQALGVYTESTTDFEFSYNGINFGYTRTYNSADKDWFEAIYSKALVTNSRLEVTLPDGSKYPMIRKDASTYVDELNGYTLTKSDSNYVFDDGQYKYYFAIKASNSVALLGAIEDYNGNRLNLDRTTNSNEMSISDGTGRTFALTDFRVIYAPDGSDAQYYSVKEITDPNGNKIEYTTKLRSYIEVKDQAGVYLGKYEYTSDTTDHTLIKSNDKSIEYYENGRLKKITYDNGSWIQYTYDDANMTYTTLTSSGEATKMVYNDAFCPVEYTDEYGMVTSYTYDDHYRVLTETCGKETTTYTYDDKGNVLSYVTGNSESNSYYTYDSNKRVIKEQVGNSYTYYTYDSNGNNLICATLKENYTGVVPAQYDSSLTCFDTTAYTYDSNGRLTSEAYSTGGSVAYEYDNRGNVTKETTVTVENGESATSVVNYTYDAFGNLLTSSTGNDTSSYIYDAAGRTLLANESGECTRTIYDNQGRVIQEIAPQDYDSAKDGLPNANTYSDANVGHRYVYDEETGNLTSETNRLGVETTYTYYSTGEKETEAFDIYKYDYNIKGNLAKVFVDGVNTLTYNYDEDCNLTSEVYANGQSIRYEYDDNGNLIKQYHNDNTSPYVIYSYNSDNELVQKVNGDAGLKYVYGENGSVSVYKTSDNTLVQSYLEEEITTESQMNGDTEIEFGDNDEVYVVFQGDPNAGTRITETHFGKTYSSFLSDRSLKYTFGENVAEYSYKNKLKPDGYADERIASDSITYNNKTPMKSDYEYDSNDNITSKSVFFYTDIFTYDAYIDNTYDSENRIITTGYGEPRVYYTYDSDGQIVRSDNCIFDYSSTFTYDDRGNILSNNKYAYTRDENISTSPTETTTFTYSNDGWNDRLISVNGTPLTYDANGNVLTYGDREYQWSGGRNLAQITDGDNTYYYTYDENGIRTSKTVNGVTTYYNTKDGVILSQSDGTNTMYFQYDTNGLPLGFIWNGTQYFYLTNQMGDVKAIIDTQGYALVEYEYDEWGTLGSIYTQDDSEEEIALANINPIRYRGYYFDNETGYYYLQSRYYDSSICRFINADDYQEVYRCKGIVNGINLFLYCYNTPLNTKDSSGYGREWVGFIVYSAQGSDFKKQANYMRNKMKGYNIATFYCVTAKDFIDAWNSFAKNYKLKDLFLFVHGAPGILCFKKCNIYKTLPKDVNKNKKNSETSYTFSKLNNLNITGKIYLNSCNGGTSDGVSESVASILAKKAPKKTVRAVVNGSVYYKGYKNAVLSGDPYTKEKGAYWADFNYHYVARDKKKVVCLTNRTRSWSL